MDGEKVSGKVRVAKYRPGTPLNETPGYRNVLIHTSAQRIPLTRALPDTIIWEHPAEVHQAVNPLRPTGRGAKPFGHGYTISALLLGIPLA